MMKHTSQPSVSPWQHKDSGSGELTINCDCNSTWGVTIIRIHGKSQLLFICDGSYVCMALIRSTYGIGLSLIISYWHGNCSVLQVNISTYTMV